MHFGVCIACGEILTFKIGIKCDTPNSLNGKQLKWWFDKVEWIINLSAKHWIENQFALYRSGQIEMEIAWYILKFKRENVKWKQNNFKLHYVQK